MSKGRERERERREGRETDANVVGDVMGNVRAFLGECDRDINAMVSGGMRRGLKANSKKKKRSEPMSHESVGPNVSNPINNRRNQLFSLLSP